MKHFLIALTALLCLSTLPALSQLPSVQLRNINGKTVDTGKLTGKGKPVIISFWALWCHPCMRELEAIHPLYPDWQDKYDVTMYIVSTDPAQDAHKVRPKVDGQAWEYEVLLDPNGDFKRQMQVQMIPHIFIYDGKGRQIYSHQGYTDGAEKELEKILKTL